MEQPLFSITCTTCQARLRVRDPEALGTILACPRCQSMVLVVAPVGWRMPTAAERAASNRPSGDPAEANSSGSIELGPAPSAPEQAAAATAEPPGDELTLPGAPPMIPPPVAPVWSASTVGWIASGVILLVAAILVVALARYSSGSAGVADVAAAETPPSVPPQPNATEPIPPPVALPAAHEPPPPVPTPKAESVAPTAAVAASKPEPVAPPPLPAAPPPAKTAIAVPRPTIIELAPPPVLAVRSPLPALDVARRLALTIPGLELKETPLDEAAALVGDLAGCPVTVDLDALESLGLSLREPVTARLEKASLQQILAKAAEGCGLSLVVEDYDVRLTAPPADRTATRRLAHPVDDLTNHDPAGGEALAEQVRLLVWPAGWKAAGGVGELRAAAASFDVQHSSAGHLRLVDFCERLRTVRKLPRRSQYSADRFPLATRADRSARTLAQPITLNFRDPMPLGQVVAALGKAAGTAIRVDWQSLGHAGAGPAEKVRLRANGLPLAAALTELTGPLGLSFRGVDAGLVEIASARTIADRLDLEFYPAADLLLDKGDRVAGVGAGDAILDRLRQGVAPATWAAAGGRGQVWFDPVSRSLVVLQSPPVHELVVRLLAEWRSGR